MERLLPSDGIDAIEKRQFGQDLDVLVCHSFDGGVAEKKYPREAKTILAGSTVQYLAGTKMRAQPGAPITRNYSIVNLALEHLASSHLQMLQVLLASEQLHTFCIGE